MKAITIKQPWATLIALGEKRFETRGWQTKYRGELAIHAGKQVDLEACKEPEIAAALARHSYTAGNLPTGAVMAVGKLTECLSIRRNAGEDGPVWLDREGHTLGWAGRMPNEYYFGDYSDGRYAWELTDVKQLPEPIPAKGQLSLWNWEGGSSHE